MKTLKSIRLVHRAVSGLEFSRIIDRMREGEQLGEAAWHESSQPEHLATLGLPGWPRCNCTVCGCNDPATTTDDQGIPVCDKCADYVVTDDGEVICARDSRVEIVCESCGAGGQMRLYPRLRPPEEPPTTPNGKWACYWDAGPDESFVVGRYSSRDEAEQSVAAKDWPPPGDHTAYLAGYEVRVLVGDRWIEPDGEPIS